MKHEFCWKELVDSGDGFGPREEEHCDPLWYLLETDRRQVHPGPGPEPITPASRDQLVKLAALVEIAVSLPEATREREALADLATRSLEAAVADLGEGFYLKRIGPA